MKKIRVLHIIQNLNIGGLEKIAVELAIALNNEKFETELWALTGTGPLENQLNDKNVIVKIFNYKRYLMPWNIISLRNKIKSSHFDVVHTHSYPPGILGRIAAKLAGVPVIIHHQHTNITSNMTNRQKVLERLASKYITDRIIVCSNDSKKILIKESFGTENNISVMFNGVKESFSQPSNTAEDLQKKLNLSKEKVIVTVASLTTHKGHIYILKAVPEIVKQFPDVKFIFAGDGPEKNNLEQFVSKNNIGRYIIFAGNQQDVRPYLEIADIFVLPSLRENMSVSIVEAMSKKLSVIASDLGGNPEIVINNQTGFLVESQNPEQLAEKIIELLKDNSKRKVFGANGYNRFKEYFTFENLVFNIQKLYLAYLNEKTLGNDNNKLMPVLFFSTYGSIAHGGQKSLWYIIRDIDKNKYLPVLVCQEDGDLPEMAKKLNIAVFFISLPRLRPKNITDIIKTMLMFNKIISKYKIQIIHSDELVAVILTFMLKLFKNFKIVWHVRVMMNAPFQKLVSLWLCDKVICVSNAVAKTFNPNFGFKQSNKICVVPNGIDLNEYVNFHDTGFINKKVSPNTEIVGFLGGLEKIKGADILIKAIPKVLNKHPLTKFLIAGSGKKEYVDYLINLSHELKIQNNLIFWGEEKEHTIELMNRFNVFILPSLTEGMSRSMLEAMILKKPIIASDIPQISEFVIHKERGILFHTGNSDELADSIVYILDNKAFAETIGINAHEFVLKNFNISNTLNKICKIFDSLFYKNL